MNIAEKEKVERQKAILALMARWVKNNDTKEKAHIVMAKSRQLKIRQPNASSPW